MYSSDRHLRSIGKLDSFSFGFTRTFSPFSRFIRQQQGTEFLLSNSDPGGEGYFRFWLHEATQNSTPPQKRKKVKKNQTQTVEICLLLSLSLLTSLSLAKFNRTWLNVCYYEQIISV